MEKFFETYKQLRHEAFTNGGSALDKKTKRLIALAASLAAGCEVGAKNSVEIARELGATEDELRETAAIAMTVTAGRVLTIFDRGSDHF